MISDKGTHGCSPMEVSVSANAKIEMTDWKMTDRDASFALLASLVSSCALSSRRSLLREICSHESFVSLDQKSVCGCEKRGH